LQKKSKINIGIAGSPDAIKSFLSYLKKSEDYNLIGTFDTSNEKNFEEFYGISPLKDFIKRADAILFCGYNHLHLFDTIVDCIKHFKHIIFEKFPDLNYTELSVLQKLRNEAETTFYITNVFGNGCVYTTARHSVNKPSFIKHKTNIPFNAKFSDHNSREILHETIDMVLRCVNSPVRKVKINQQFIFNQRPDEVKIHITYDNSTHSEIVLNTISTEHQNVMTLYQTGKIITADILDFKVLETRIDLDLEHKLPFEDLSSNTAVTQKMNQFEKKILYFDVIQKDLLNFVDCITNHVSPMVSLEEAMEVVNVMQHFTYSQHESIV
jgi:predicted dehydrogenase